MRSAYRWFLIGIICLLLCPIALAEDQPSEEQVKAAFLFNFAKFTEWPGTAFPDDSTPLTICIWQSEKLADELKLLANGRQIQGRPIVIKNISSSTELNGSQMVYTGALSGAELSQLTSVSQNSSILTVGDASEFIKKGGIIKLFSVDDKIHFDISVDNAASSGIKLSSKLLKLADSAEKEH